MLDLLVKTLYKLLW